MTTDFDSFDESPLHVFVESSLGVRNGVMPSVGGRVLVWLRNTGYFTEPTFYVLKAVFEDMGHPTDVAVDGVNPGWTGNINNYVLVIWPIAVANVNGEPPWLGDVRRGTWTGRICVTAEYSSLSDSIFYVESLSPLTGIHLRGGLDLGQQHGPGYWDGPAYEHPLTVDVATIAYKDTCLLDSGGLPVSRVLHPPDPLYPVWIMSNQVGTVNWVVCGDSTAFSDGQYFEPPTNFAYLNRRFLKNMAEVL